MHAVQLGFVFKANSFGIRIIDIDLAVLWTRVAILKPRQQTHLVPDLVLIGQADVGDLNLKRNWAWHLRTSTASSWVLNAPNSRRLQLSILSPSSLPVPRGGVIAHHLTTPSNPPLRQEFFSSLLLDFLLSFVPSFTPLITFIHTI